jgi:shikimate O-hydroxycinnamoyltransferase
VKQRRVQRTSVKPLLAAQGRTRCSAVEQVVSIAVPSGAFGYAERLEPLRLERALAEVLADYGVMAGRFVRDGGALWIEHAVGIPFEVAARTETVAELFAMLREQHSKIVCPPLPVRAAMRGKGALLALRLTQARDGSVLGVTWNHGLGDASSIVALLRAWSLASRGQPYPRPPEITDRGAYLDAKVPLAPRVDTRARVLPWREVLRAFAYQLRVLRARRVALDFTWQQIDEIHAAASRERPLSPSDALCAHILHRLHELGVDLSPEVTIAVDFRKAFGIPPAALGNFSDLVFTPVKLEASLSEGAEAIRANLAAFLAGEVSGTMNHRRVAQLRAANSSELDVLRFWFFGESGRGNLRLSNMSRSAYNKLVFADTPPAFVHMRASDVPLVGTGVLFPSPNAAGLTLDIVLPGNVAAQLRSSSPWKKRSSASRTSFGKSSMTIPSP